MEVVLRGWAKSFNEVALQSDSFAGEKFIQEPIFSDINLDESGNILFSFSAILDPSLISYGNVVKADSGSSE